MLDRIWLCVYFFFIAIAIAFAVLSIFVAAEDIKYHLWCLILKALVYYFSFKKKKKKIIKVVETVALYF